MLGQLLHSFNPSRRGVPRPPTMIESEVEDAHTKNLLFPDAAILLPEGQAYHLSSPPSTVGNVSGNGYDGTQEGNLSDLEHSRDVRFIIAQDEVHGHRAVLFDSKQHSLSESPKESPTMRAVRRPSVSGGPSLPPTGAFSSRRASLTSEITPPRSPAALPGGGVFFRSRARNTSISSMPNIDETTSNRTWESDEIVKTCLDCMFGNVAMGYRGPGYKFHIVPLEPKAPEQSIPSPILEGSSSFGRAEGRRRSNLARSYTPSNPPPDLPPWSAESPNLSNKDAPRRTLIYTRTFSVPDQIEPTTGTPRDSPMTPHGSLNKGHSFPFSRNDAGNRPSNLHQQRSRATKSPMYAITLIVHLPVSQSRPSVRFPKMAQRTPGSLHGHDSLASSLDSDQRAGWSLIDTASVMDSFWSSTSDVDERVDAVGHHWDVITRTLNALQVVAQKKIIELFKAQGMVDSAVPASQLSNRTSLPTQNGHPQGNRQHYLRPYELAFDKEIKNAVARASERVVRGMKIPRVITGQGRWGVWREEARWLGRWAGGRDQNFFFFNLLTAFLGTHTEWLSILGPKWHRKRHYEQQKSNVGEDIGLFSRTVIASTDKMAARRLIFLLSTFLPASHITQDNASPARPSTSASFRAYSQSPPSNLTVSRQPSLRRTINRRGNRSRTNMKHSLPGKGQESSTANVTEESESADPSFSQYHHSRRPSEALSFVTIADLPNLSHIDLNARKCSAATTSTVTPEDAIPVAHFTSHRGTHTGPRPGSSSSLASTNLINALQRNNSATASSPSSESQPSRWGSLMSFWSSNGRRESSTDHSDILQTTDEGLGISGAGPRVQDRRSKSRLEQMVDEAGMVGTYKHDFDDPSQPVSEDSAASSRQLPSDVHIIRTAGRPIPARPRTSHSPLKLSVNSADGVIDVDIPIPSFGSPLNSPFLGAAQSVSSAEGGSSYGQTSIQSYSRRQDHENRVNVAGWLSKFHPDFSLQGVNQYPELERDIREAMQLEPTPLSSSVTPTIESGPVEKWIDVAQTLIADTTSFTVKRIRLRRHVRLIPMPNQPAMTPGPHAQRSQYGNPYSMGAGPNLPMTEMLLGEQWDDEQICDLDGILADAVERVLATSTTPDTTKDPSRVSSRSSSVRGRPEPEEQAIQTPVLEIPKHECKCVVLGALEQIVKTVNKGEKRAREKAEGKNIQESKRKERLGAGDSTLRDGVRRWLRDVEDAAAK
ncbi:hypothetical protein M501DRAFT_975697 [Patellaria atrata CBS 101060]|uniref:Folliculin-interacting protein N-terminal domain-containing protein n=1 Tax=Patellaria atrata CBS 101060 TaxID=1346257 RepID=A0A9P4SAF3_9PEZI|nr:hypothetical protein M501DRAFT_975697 [Patellaria atrata CBS 101060]